MLFSFPSNLGVCGPEMGFTIVLADALHGLSLLRSVMRTEMWLSLGVGLGSSGSPSHGA